MTDKPAPTDRQEAEPAAPATATGADIIYLPDQRQRTKKATSGSEKRKRTTSVRVRLHPDDAEQLKRDAAAAGMSVAGYLAKGRLDEEKANRPRLKRRRQVADVPALMDALAAFNRVGNNHNQIARALNELLLIAHERSNAGLESLVLELLEGIRGMPALLAEPIAAIRGVLNNDREG
jgi:hypothetical protein